MDESYAETNARVCRRCGSEKSLVFDVRVHLNKDILIRKRRCCGCGCRWSTVEIRQDDFDRYVAPHYDMMK